MSLKTLQISFLALAWDSFVTFSHPMRYARQRRRQGFRALEGGTYATAAASRARLRRLLNPGI